MREKGIEKKIRTDGLRTEAKTLKNLCLRNRALAFLNKRDKASTSDKKKRGRRLKMSKRENECHLLETGLSQKRDGFAERQAAGKSAHGAACGG